MGNGMGFHLDPTEVEARIGQQLDLFEESGGQIRTLVLDLVTGRLNCSQEEPLVIGVDFFGWREGQELPVTTINANDVGGEYSLPMAGETLIEALATIYGIPIPSSDTQGSMGTNCQFGALATDFYLNGTQIDPCCLCKCGLVEGDTIKVVPWTPVN